jgi:MFS family permease
MTIPLSCERPFFLVDRVRSRSTLLLLLIYLAFVSLGLPDGAFGAAWPAVYPDLQLPIGLAGTILTLGTVFTSVSAFSSGWLLARWTAGPVVLVSCLLTASGLLVISGARDAAWLYVSAIPLGFGAGAVDASLNGYVARHYSGRHMNWLHACWGIGATSGPLIVGWAIAGAHGWRHGYLVLAIAQFGLAVVLLLTLGWWKQVPETSSHETAGGAGGAVPTTPANSPAGWLAPAIFAGYVAAEMTMGVWTGTVLVKDRGYSEAAAAICTACFYGAITGGRILIGFVVDRFGNRTLVRWGMLAAVAGGIGFVCSGQQTVLAALALILTGVGFAPVYPCLMHEVPKRFAPDAVQTVIGRQSGAAALGAAVLPALAGWVAQVSLPVVPWLVVGVSLVLIAAIAQLNRMT